ncbi:hypothetical protein KRP22_001655 [Phytophthora ramorum]|uniref:uncharacterized protein n=1 Tax=Phytophthora ramorum TaxID=164328 RepID=UPI00309900BF|nr:hypothetical protein KRP23_13261 [Phytophthora ramorum]KAH7509435.1 hypothetical protein KRP22_936 [Phytophthora ramorum]
MASMSSSEQGSEDQWDDLAIVRAFEQALTDQQRSTAAQSAAGRKHKAASRSNGKKAARSVSLDEGGEGEDEDKHAHASAATGAAATGMYGQPTAAAYGGFSTGAGTFGYPQQQQQQQSSDLYQAAYTQAYAQLQAQFQAAYPAAAPQPYGPGAQNLGQMPSFAAQSPYYPPPPTPFPGMPGASAPFPGSVPSAAGSDDGLANVLMAWYQSGYYTGRFQAMQEMKMRGHR